MKRSMILMLSCLCALLLCLFTLSACGGNDSGSSKSGAANSANNSASASGNGDEADIEDLNEDEIRAAFEQALMGMSEFYEGKSPVGQEIYYAGGADGENAMLIIVEPESNFSVFFNGAAEVGDDNTLTITDSMSGSVISFEIFDNGDGTYSFDMNGSAAVMYRCTSATIIDVLTTIVMQADSTAAETPEAEGAEAENAEGASE